MKIICLLLLAALLGGCGGGDPDEPEDSLTNTTLPIKCNNPNPKECSK